MERSDKLKAQVSVRASFSSNWLKHFTTRNPHWINTTECKFVFGANDGIFVLMNGITYSLQFLGNVNKVLCIEVYGTMWNRSGRGKSGSKSWSRIRSRNIRRIISITSAAARNTNWKILILFLYFIRLFEKFSFSIIDVYSGIYYYWWNRDTRIKWK